MRSGCSMFHISGASPAVSPMLKRLVPVAPSARSQSRVSRRRDRRRMGRLHGGRRPGWARRTPSAWGGPSQWASKGCKIGCQARRLVMIWRLRLGHAARHLRADRPRRRPGRQVGADLAEDVLLARLLEVGADDLARIGVGLLAGLAQEPRGPEAQQPVAPRLGPELHLGVVGELGLEGVLAVVEGGHRPGLSSWSWVGPVCARRCPPAV